MKGVLFGAGHPCSVLPVFLLDMVHVNTLPLHSSIVRLKHECLVLEILGGNTG